MADEQEVTEVKATETEPEKEGDVSTKMYDEHEEAVVMVEKPSGPTSWEELDAKQQAVERAANMQQVASQFQRMVHNVLVSDMENKSAAIMALSNGLTERLNETKERIVTSAPGDNLKTYIVIENGVDDEQVGMLRDTLSPIVGDWSIECFDVKEQLAITADILSKEQHYKEVAHDDTLAVESDFLGGCNWCGFGDPVVVKELANCPYCWNELEVSDDA